MLVFLVQMDQRSVGVDTARQCEWSVRGELGEANTAGRALGGIPVLPLPSLGPRTLKKAFVGLSVKGRSKCQPWRLRWD